MTDQRAALDGGVEQQHQRHRVEQHHPVAAARRGARHQMPRPLRSKPSGERAGIKVLVAFASSEMPLWKAAGATHCATGKFFNLHRFTRTRFEEPPAGGGGALPYWFEESLFAFLRASDVVRARPHGLLDRTVTENPFAREILERMDKTPGAAERIPRPPRSH